LGIPPKDVRMASLKATFSKELNYGYDQPLIPVGGPQALVDQLVEAFQKWGGTLMLETPFAPNGDYRDSVIISSEGRWQNYPKHFRPGLAISTLHLALKQDFKFPKDLHTVVYFPPNIAEWLNQLDAGIQPKAFGFHLFPSETANPTYNLYFYLPRGVEALPQAAEDYIFSNVEKILPGFNSAILYKKFVSPKTFKELHGFSSNATPLIVEGDFQKPDSYDPESAIYFIGNSVKPEGEHAGGAMFSGIRAAQQILSRGPSHAQGRRAR
jgi:phytoene dehydrogenase-like protein